LSFKAPFTTFSRVDHDLATRWASSRATVAIVARRQASAGTLHAGELEIRLGEGLVLAGQTPLTLSVREFELLVAMARRAGTIVTRGELFRAVWGAELRPGDRSVDVYMSKLRAKLEEAMPDRRFIHTHPGFGYRFQPQPSRAAAARAAAPIEAPAGANSLSRDVHIGGSGA
jgi:DNA-binding response OmpR family regulator